MGIKCLIVKLVSERAIYWLVDQVYFRNQMIKLVNKSNMIRKQNDWNHWNKDRTDSTILVLFSLWSTKVFHVTGLFLHSLKISERGYRKIPAAWNWLIIYLKPNPSETKEDLKLQIPSKSPGTLPLRSRIAPAKSKRILVIEYQAPSHFSF